MINKRVDGKAVGTIGVFLKDDAYCKSAKIGYWLGEAFWNRGIMNAAVKQICNFAFEKYDYLWPSNLSGALDNPNTRGV